MNDAAHIASPLYRYAKLMDSGDLAGTADLFAPFVLDPDAAACQIRSRLVYLT